MRQTKFSRVDLYNIKSTTPKNCFSISTCKNILQKFSPEICLLYRKNTELKLVSFSLFLFYLFLFFILFFKHLVLALPHLLFSNDFRFHHVHAWKSNLLISVFGFLSYGESLSGMRIYLLQ